MGIHWVLRWEYRGKDTVQLVWIGGRLEKTTIVGIQFNESVFVLRFHELNVWTGIVFLWSLNWKERRETFPRLRYEYLIFESFEIFLMIQPNIVVVCALYIIPVCAKNRRIFNKIHVTSYKRHMLRLKSNILNYFLYFLCVNQD